MKRFLESNFRECPRNASGNYPAMLTGKSPKERFARLSRHLTKLSGATSAPGMHPQQVAQLHIPPIDVRNHPLYIHRRKTRGGMTAGVIDAPKVMTLPHFCGSLRGPRRRCGFAASTQRKRGLRFTLANRPAMHPNHATFSALANNLELGNRLAIVSDSFLVFGHGDRCNTALTGGQR